MGSGIHGPPGPGTDPSESIRDFQNFVGPDPSRLLEFFLGPGPVRIFRPRSRDLPVLVRGSLRVTQSNVYPPIKPGIFMIFEREKR